MIQIHNHRPSGTPNQTLFPQCKDNRYCLQLKPMMHGNVTNHIFVKKTRIGFPSSQCLCSTLRVVRFRVKSNELTLPIQRSIFPAQSVFMIVFPGVLCRTVRIITAITRTHPVVSKQWNLGHWFAIVNGSLESVLQIRSRVCIAALHKGLLTRKAVLCRAFRILGAIANHPGEFRFI